MLERIKHWFTVPPENPGEFTEQDERILEHDNAQYAANLGAIEQAKSAPRYRFRFWFFFF